MSLVNDMLRDLDARRAAPSERVPLEGLYAVDEEGARRRERSRRLRLGSMFLGAVILTGLLVGLMIGRIVGRTPEGPVLAAPTPVAAVAVPQVLEVLPQHVNGRFVLQLLLDHSVAYQRTDESGAVSLRLPGLRLSGEPRSGRLQQDGRSLSWRVEPQGNDVLVLLVGLGDQLQVSDRLEPAGARWQLWLEAQMQGADVTQSEQPEQVDLSNLPAADDESAAPEQTPAWQVRAEPASQPAPVARPQVTITARPADPLAEARQAMLDQDYAVAVAQLERVHRLQPRDADAIRLLARAYLGAGQQDKLLGWLPTQLAQVGDDSELRILLARAQLQSGQTQAAVATLAQRRPLLARDPGYHALLAATYQQTGQWRESAEVYRQLVDLRPQQAPWQLGLAIALEQLEQPQQAAQHYQLALRGQGLDDGARRFAISRAQTLGGQP